MRRVRTPEMLRPTKSAQPGIGLSPPRFGILLVSAAVLAYEVLLMRLFSIVQWHHFAYMIISLALLGYGASGTFMSMAGDRLAARFTRSFVVCAALFGFSAVGCFMLVQRLPFNTLEMFWSHDQWFYLLLSYLLLFIPFFFGAICICLSFTRFPERIPMIYTFDLIGAGIGALGVIALLTLFTPTGTLQLVAAAGLCAAALGAVEGRRRPKRGAALACILAAFTIASVPSPWLSLNSAEYKPLSQALQIPGARVLTQNSSPLGLISVVESPLVPLRIAEGLSLNNSTELPPQLGLFVDGDAAGALTMYRGDARTLAWTDYQTSALPYHTRRPERALILGMGGGSGVLQAVYHDTPQIEVVEANAQVARLVQERYATFTGWNTLGGRVRVHVGEPRNFIASGNGGYDLIQISLLDGAGAASGGVYGLSENYLYTAEGIARYLSRLNHGGQLAITRWVHLPPRDTIKLFATAVDGLRRAGLEAAERRLMLIRGWNTSTLIVQNEPVDEAQIRQLRSFCAQRSFDLAYYPGMEPVAANRYNLLTEPYFFQGAKALLGDGAESYFDRYKFHIRPASDDRPFFFDFFKWSTLPEILSIYRLGGVSLLELGYPILILTLLQAMVVSIPLVLLPLLSLKERTGHTKAPSFWSIAGYFVAIGLGYMFIEIAFIQKFILFLAHPIYSVAVILCGFLVFSGLGSALAGRLLKRGWSGVHILIVVLLIALCSLANLWLLPGLFSGLADLAMTAKILVTLALIAPLAFLMGMPFPAGLARVSRLSSRLGAWAWGINGFASLTGAVLATLLAVHIGFNWLVIVAIFCYLLAALSGTGGMQRAVPEPGSQHQREIAERRSGDSL